MEAAKVFLGGCVGFPGREESAMLPYLGTLETCLKKGGRGILCTLSFLGVADLIVCFSSADHMDSPATDTNTVLFVK